MSIAAPKPARSPRCRSPLVRRVLLGAMLATMTLGIAATPAQAQTVELLDFGIRSLPEASAPIDPDSPPGVEAERLAHDFHLLGVGAPALSLTGSVDPTTVPLWMRSGKSPSADIALGISGSGLPCAALPYRPRRDLALATEARRARLFPMVAQAACEAGLPVGLFDALIVQESRYNTAVISPKGAIGLSQLMPGTARYLSVTNPFDALSNLRGGARYLREQLTAFGRVDLALAAYNAGPGRVRSRWAVPRIAETRDYVSNVTRGWHMGVAREAALLDFRAVRQPILLPAISPGRTAQLLVFGGER